jgi:hypothetical protein
MISCLHYCFAALRVARGSARAKHAFVNAAREFVDRNSRSANGRRGWVARRIAIELLVVAAVGLALAALGPFGSYSVPFGPRTLFWMGSMLVGYAIVRPMIGVSRWLAEETGIGRFPGQLLALTVAAVPLSLLVQLASTRLGASGETGPCPFLRPGLGDRPCDDLVHGPLLPPPRRRSRLALVGRARSRPARP